MIGLTFLITVGFSLAAVTMLCMVATRESGLVPATVNPFGDVRFSPSAADTLPNGAYEATTLAGDWQSAEFQTLHQVEDMLDWLENHDVRHTELQPVGGKFVVRWR